MSPIFILGAAGFLGGHLLRHLRSQYGGDVVGLDLPDKPIDEGGETVDILDRAALESLISRYRPGAVVNCSGLLSSPDPLELFRVNALGSSQLLNAVEKVLGDKCRIILIGSAAEYGLIGNKVLPVSEDQPLNPVSPYGISKAAQTFFARGAAKQGMDVITARIFNLFGPGLSPRMALSSFARQLVRVEAGETTFIETGPLGARRDYIDVFQTVEALRVLIEEGVGGEEYNICSGISWSMRDLVDILCSLIKGEAEVRERPGTTHAFNVPDIYGTAAKLNSLGFAMTPPDMKKHLTMLLDFWREELH